MKNNYQGSHIELRSPLASAMRNFSEMYRSLLVALRVPEGIAKLKAADAEKLARYAWVGGIALIVLNVAMVFSPMFGARASTAARPPGLENLAAVHLADRLRQAGLEASLIESLAAKRSGLSVQGVTIALGGDAIQAFSYGSAPAAAQEGKEFAAGYFAEAGNGLEQPLSLYQQDGLLVLYFGNRENILKALEAAMGAPLAGGVALAKPA